jgi:hypothetical protein
MRVSDWLKIFRGACMDAFISAQRSPSTISALSRPPSPIFCFLSVGVQKLFKMLKLNSQNAGPDRALSCLQETSKEAAGETGEQVSEGEDDHGDGQPETLSSTKEEAQEEEEQQEEGEGDEALVIQILGNAVREFCTNICVNLLMQRQVCC